MGHILKDLISVWRTILVIVLPIILLPFPLVVDSSVARCAYGLILMAVFWVTEALPLPVTSLLPVLVFPMFGVTKVGDVCSNYIKNTSMFGLGGLSIAIAMEKWNLHKRMALRALLLFGSEPKWLMFGFMLPTWFLSMWVSNTSSTAMMLPIVVAVLSELKDIDYFQNTSETTSGGIAMAEMEHQHEDKSLSANKLEIEDKCIDSPVTTAQTRVYVDSVKTKSEEKYVKMCKGMSLCVAYAANIGGTATVSGTGTNLVTQGQVEIVFNRVGETSPINFASWMVFGLPMSLLAIVLCWFWLQFLFLDWRDVVSFCRKRPKANDRVSATIRAEYTKLGPISFAEKAVLCHFIALTLLWLTRSPPYVKGWGSFFLPGYVKDSAAAIFTCISLFVFPSTKPKVFCFGRRDEIRGPVPSILDWPTVEKNFPWGVLLLLGGGYALADSCERSGLSKWIGNNLTFFEGLQPWLLVFLLTISVAILTEVTSNTATATLLLPILARLAQTLGFNPLYLMFPCALATSFAFMLPVATPPNALVFATGYIQIKDMVKAGIGMNTICLLVLLLATNTWGNAFFNFHHLPDAFRTEMSIPSPLNTTGS